MKISCEIIKDLLPIYIDEVCSDETRSLIATHLKGCSECKSELQKIERTLPINNVRQNLNEAEAIINLSKRWRRGMKKSVIKGIIIALVTILLIALLLHLFIGIQIIY